MPATLSYRSEIDGLRAVAVVPVIFFHAGLPPFSGGFVGVDVFFVISGYLITRILQRELERDKFSLIAFYERRARRIVPALFVVVVCCLPAAWLWMSPAELQAFAASVFAASLFGSNVLFWLESGYFEGESEDKPLLHTWSLAIEEQYYLVFPLLLMLLWRYRRNQLTVVIALLAAASFLLCEALSRTHPSAAFYLAPTRVWELLAGSLCALLMINREARRMDLLAGPGLLLIIAAMLMFDQSIRFPSVYTLLPVLGTALVILFAGPGTYTARLLSTPLLVGIGLISYSAYLWHQPLFAFARIRELGEPPLETMVLLALLTPILATVTWRFVEQPFRRSRLSPSMDPYPILRGAAASLGVMLFLGAVGQLGVAESLSRFPKEPEFGWREKVRTDLCLLRSQRVKEHAPDCFEQGRFNVLLWGDSHAASLYPGFRALQTRHDFAVTQLTHAGCPPLLDVAHTPYRTDCNDLNQRALKHIDETSYDRIILHAAWEHFTYPMERDDLQQRLENTLKAVLDRVDERTELLIVGPVPRWPDSAYKTYLRRADTLTASGNGNLMTPAIALWEVDNLLQTTAQSHAAGYVSALEVFCQPDRDDCAIALGRGIKYLTAVDKGHLSDLGSEYLTTRLWDTLSAGSLEQAKANVPRQWNGVKPLALTVSSTASRIQPH